ncbi:MAG: hypothetical protein RMA76_27255 [Deltaproteobacteria bacterium]|jgi:hypothetical protein
MNTSKMLIMASALAAAFVWVALPAALLSANPNVSCPPCTYDISRQELTGTLDPGYTAHPFPFTGMTLTLVDGSDNVLDTIADLPPSFQYGSTVLDQVIDTDVTSGVAKAQLEWMDDDNNPVSQTITVVP